MEEYHQMIAGDIYPTYLRSKEKQVLTTRTTLRLVCKQFDEIIKAIPNVPRKWILRDDNEPRSYRAPVPRWYTREQYEGIELRLDFERSTVVSASYPPVTIFSLFIRRTSQPSDPLYETGAINSASDIIQHPEKLQALHLRLDHCQCLDPVEVSGHLSAFTLLTTLSLRLGTSNLRDIINEPLCLPNLRVLFFDFVVFQVDKKALQLWTFERLSILSLDLRIASRGVHPVHSMPDVITSFIRRHGTSLYGLRLTPGPWSRPRTDGYLLPMEREAEWEFWASLPVLEVLSTNFNHFGVIAPEEHQNDKATPFRNVVRLNQLGRTTPSTILLGLTQAIEMCIYVSEIHVPFAGPPWYLKALEVHEKASLQRLHQLCSLRNVALHYSL